MFFSEVWLGQGESVYPDLKEGGEGGFYQTKNPKTNALSRVVFSMPRGKFCCLLCNSFQMVAKWSYSIKDK